MIPVSVFVKKIKISNFLSLSDIEFDFKKTNIFIGENNSGKSAILKAIALLCQSVEKWDFNGPLLDFGSSKRIATNDSLAFAIELTLDLQYITSKTESSDVWFSVDSVEVSANYGTFTATGRAVPVTGIWSVLKLINDQEILSLSSLLNVIDTNDELSIFDDSDYQQLHDFGRNLDVRSLQLTDPQDYENRLVKFIHSKYLSGNGLLHTEKIVNLRDEGNFDIIGEGKFYYRNYHTNPNSDDILEYIARTLSNAVFLKVPRPKIKHFYDQREEVPEEIHPNIDQISEIIANSIYYKDYGLPEIINQINEGGKEFELPNLTSSHHPRRRLSLDTQVGVFKIPLSESGFGMNQVFLLLSGLLASEKDTLFFIEEPETSLHPKNQAGIFDFIHQVTVEKNLQTFITTHSSHLLTRLQRRIAEGKIDKNDIGVFWCELDENRLTKVHTVNIEEDGSFPDGLKTYLDFVVEEQKAIAEARQKRSRGEEK